MKTKTFAIVALSENTNSFGLQQAIMVAKDGEAWKACKNPQFMPKRGKTIELPLMPKTNKVDFSGKFEIPERIENTPPEVVEEAFKNIVS